MVVYPRVHIDRVEACTIPVSKAANSRTDENECAIWYMCGLLDQDKPTHFLQALTRNVLHFPVPPFFG